MRRAPANAGEYHAISCAYGHQSTPGWHTDTEAINPANCSFFLFLSFFLLQCKNWMKDNARCKTGYIFALKCWISYERIGPKFFFTDLSLSVQDRNTCFLLCIFLGRVSGPVRLILQATKHQSGGFMVLSETYSRISGMSRQRQHLWCTKCWRTRALLDSPWHLCSGMIATKGTLCQVFNFLTFFHAKVKLLVDVCWALSQLLMPLAFGYKWSL